MKNLEDEIRRVAYDFYEKSGRLNGHDVENWLKAEKFVLEKYRSELKKNPRADIDKKALDNLEKKIERESAGLKETRAKVKTTAVKPAKSAGGKTAAKKPEKKRTTKSKPAGE